MTERVNEAYFPILADALAKQAITFELVGIFHEIKNPLFGITPQIILCARKMGEIKDFNPILIKQFIKGITGQQ
jgi:nitrogen-specific signal transduction histidine kinase